MIKKLASIGVGVAFFLSTAAPAFAVTLPSTTITNVGTSVVNSVWTKANTGWNTLIGAGSDLATMITGNAGASSSVKNNVNSTEVIPCACSNNISVTNEGTSVVNSVWTKANTGHNTLVADPSEVVGSLMATGNAGASSSVDNVVNTTLVGF